MIFVILWIILLIIILWYWHAVSKLEKDIDEICEQIKTLSLDRRHHFLRPSDDAPISLALAFAFGVARRSNIPELLRPYAFRLPSGRNVGAKLGITKRSED